MRKNLLFLLLGLFIFSSCSQEGKRDSDWLALIEGTEKITYGEFKHFLDMTLKMNLSQGEAAVKQKDVEFQKTMLDSFIAQRIVLKEVEESKIVTPELMDMFQLQALSKYFMYKNITPKLDLPTDAWLTAQYAEKKVKDELAKRGITSFEGAKPVLAAEYQKMKYFQVLSDEMKKLKYEYRKKVNDDFEEDIIKKYALDQLPQQEYAKKWVFQIEGVETTVEEMDRFVKTMILANYGEEGIKRYEKEKEFRSSIRQQVFEDFFAAILVQTDAKTKNWINDAETKSFIKIYIDTEKTKYFMKSKIATQVEKPTLAEVQAYYNQYRNEIKKPFNEVKNYLEYKIFSEKAEQRALRYVERIKNEKKIEINNTFFDSLTPKKEKKEEVTKN